MTYSSRMDLSEKELTIACRSMLDSCVGIRGSGDRIIDLDANIGVFSLCSKCLTYIKDLRLFSGLVWFNRDICR